MNTRLFYLSLLTGAPLLAPALASAGITSGWTAESNQANAEFGTCVATAGDVNGDGYSDVIVGAPRFDNGQSDEGRALLFLGSPAGLSATPTWTAEGDQVNAFFGRCVASAGDVNGDGFHDVIIGAESFDNGQTDEGRAFVFLGSATGLGAVPAWTAEGEQVSANFGNAVATAGDVNADGYDDVVVGARFADSGETDEGLVYVYHGSAAGLSPSAAWIGQSNQASAFFGWSIGTAGDVNSDGYADIVVGAMGYDNGQTDEGRAFVYHGSAAGLGAASAWTGESNQTNAFYGWSVSTAGDLDGDGFCDAIVGALSYDNSPVDEGAAFVYRGSGLGLGTTPAWSFESGQGFSEFGASVATAGDVNGDGFADLLVGAPSYDNGQTNEGRATLCRGSATGPVVVDEWSGEGDQGGAFFGTSVATAGDVNGDGFSDFIVGASAFDNGETNEGRAFVYHGSGGVPAHSPTWIAPGDQIGAEFATSAATAGDVNGDGYSDVIVGAHSYDHGEEDEGRAFVYLGSATGLATIPAWITEGDQAGAWYGYSVATAGDVNGDGYSDVIVGAPLFDNGQTNEGRAFLYLGSPTGLAASPAWTVESDQAAARLGWALGSAGDINGDGFSDVVVAALFFDNDQLNEGRAWAYLGSAGGLSTSAVWSAEGDQTSAQFGASVGTAGDVNGDGFSDIVIGAPFYANGQNEEGRAFGYYGSASGLGNSPGWAAEGDQIGAHFGGSVGTAGDVNGDGFSDVIVGADLYDNGQTDEGRAFVYLGSFAGLVLFPAWTMEPDVGGSAFGFWVATAGDLDCDGFSDIVVGVPSFVTVGGVFAYRGSPAGPSISAGWVHYGDQFGDRFAYSAGAAGDVNGDGFSDVIVGVPQTVSDKGKLLVYYGDGGDGLSRAPRQMRTDGAAPIALLGESDSPSAFRLAAVGRTAAGRGKIRLAYEIKPFGTPFDGAGVVNGPVVDTGVPIFGSGSSIALSELATGLEPESLYHWRLRFSSDSPFFPRSPWIGLAANGSAEADLRTAAASTDIADASPSTERTWLGPGSPSPFSNTTRLDYTLPESGLVRLSVFDVSGREVVVLTDEIQPGGRHTNTWNGDAEGGQRLPPGVYFVRLEFGQRAQTRKVVFVR